MNYDKNNSRVLLRGGSITIFFVRKTKRSWQTKSSLYIYTLECNGKVNLKRTTRQRWAWATTWTQTSHSFDGQSGHNLLKRDGRLHICPARHDTGLNLNGTTRQRWAWATTWTQTSHSFDGTMSLREMAGSTFARHGKARHMQANPGKNILDLSLTYPETRK